jgi:hypothetical protein
LAPMKQCALPKSDGLRISPNYLEAARLTGHTGTMGTPLKGIDTKLGGIKPPASAKTDEPKKPVEPKKTERLDKRIDSIQHQMNSRKES